MPLRTVLIKSELPVCCRKQSARSLLGAILRTNAHSQPYDGFDERRFYLLQVFFDATKSPEA
jgi:hypothetical protein